jgi:acyl-[acyl-carrier-protein]-phospholipid O-acyltransferase/long-chain-fatty-acid--[acyl-carrier-protein] ligase
LLWAAKLLAFISKINRQWDETVPEYGADKTIFSALLDARDQFGGKRPALEDPERAPLTYNRLILGALVLGKSFADITQRGEVVGLLLPSVNAAVVSLFALSAYGRVISPLNFTSGLKNIRSAIQAAEINTVITSHRFVEMAKLEELVEGLVAQTGVRIVYLEDVRKAITSLDKAKAVLKAPIARLLHVRHALDPHEAAVILFTSGSEGEPKGVALTNANLITNVTQSMRHLGPELGPPHILLNPLPVFHSYGLMAGVLLGLYAGIKVILYPSPIQYRQVAKITRETGATILLGTDTFLQGWMRAADQGDFDSVRFVVAGAERVKDETRRIWAKSGTVLLEGYGVTECSPVVAVNTLEDNLPGTVGRALAGQELRLEPVEGIAEGGRLYIRGPNVMAGYIYPSMPGVLVPPEEGWHDTGDIVSIDEAGFITIKGRVKRFAKIGGEMVSLGAVETLAAELWPDGQHVAVTLPDPKKGEQIILVTDVGHADRMAVLAQAQKNGYPELWVPRAVLVTQSIPILGSGKVDVVATTELAKSMRAMLM